MTKKILGIDAKERLLQTAIKVFAKYGFEGASTRILTQEAQVNISAISYYFGDKTGLYRAVLENIAQTVKTSVIEKTATLRADLLHKDLPPHKIKDGLNKIVGTFLDFLLGGKIPLPAAQIFIREQMDPSDSFSIIFDDTMRPMLDAITRLVASLTGHPFPSEKATLCAHAIIGQMTVFKTHRGATLRCLNHNTYSPKDVKHIIDTVITHTEFIIDGYRRQMRKKI